jgi:thiamine biosynthesis lipoprotein
MKQFQNTLGRKKHKIVLWFVTSCIFLLSCKEENALQQISGETQGTTYLITLVDKKQAVTKKTIDSILYAFDLSLSGYIPNSTLSAFNQSPREYAVPPNDFYFMECFHYSEKIASKTDGLFDPTVLPLMELWGFLKDMNKLPSQSEIDSVKEFVGFNNPNLSRIERQGKSISIIKLDPRLRYDFNAIAQGYSVDVLADYLKLKGYKNFYVEIGGEIYVSGHNPDGNPWRLGVDKPVATNDGKTKRVISAVINIENGGIATSGNYRKFYKKDGKIYAHTLNPKTGYPAENELLSATVIAKSAAIADGMATAFMVMGLEKAKSYLETKDHDHLEVLFIYRGEGNTIESYASKGMEEKMD